MSNAENQITEFDPSEVARIVEEALRSNRILPFSFIETTLFERLSTLLAAYVPQADVVYMLSDLKEHFFSGFTSFTAQELHQTIRICKKCKDCDQVSIDPQLPMWNRTDPDLMIVLDNPTVLKNTLNFLANSLKKAGFSSQRCNLTYVTRCPAISPNSEVVSNCLPYLHSEIAFTNPKLILTFGLSSYAALTGDSSVKLADVRGNVFWFGPYAIMPEKSLLTLPKTFNNDSEIEEYLIPILKKAHTFLYGGKSET